MISLDTETIGLDLHHGAQPYLVTTCDEQQNNTWWEWDVDPLTRTPDVVYGDLGDIQQVIDDADHIVLQNAKFDVTALQKTFLGRLHWDWGKVYDTLLAGHLLASNQPHNLTTMVLIYLGVNVQPYEDAVKKATTECRRLCQGKHPKYPWRIASKDLSEMPSAKGTPWKYDMWLPRAVAQVEKRSKSDPYWTVTSEYANSDSSTTIALFQRQRELLEERGLWDIYLERLKVLPIVYQMQNHGVSISGERLKELEQSYTAEANYCHKVCVGAADGEIKKLPVTGVSNALRSVVFDKFDLQSTKKTKKGAASMDKEVLESWLISLPRRSKAYTFVKNLRAYRKRATAISYMKLYRRFWLPLYRHPRKRQIWYVLHPSLNPTGTDTLRWSSQNPNQQNISKQEGFNLRYCFGPSPGREWWSCDAKNIELRIPAYEVGEPEMVDLFERQNDPPYYGSYHMLIFDTLHPKRFAEHGMNCKKVFASSWYQWTKNGNFAVQYGAMPTSGTADRAYHVPGAQQRIQGRFKKIKALGDRMIDLASRQGYVETIPDKTVDPSHGYPLLCTRTKWGSILPTVPLNYHVSGTAMWWMMKAMIRCQAYLDELNAKSGSFGYHMIMQVHDELVFDFPKGRAPKSNLPKVRRLRHLMEQGGDGIDVTTPVSIDYHAKTWGEGEAV